MINDDIEHIKEIVKDSKGVIINSQNYFIQLPNSFTRNINLNIYEKMIYIYLWGFAGNSQYGYPGMARISRELGITKPTIIKTLKSLEEKNGLYIINRKYAKNKKIKATNLYYLAEIDYNNGSFMSGSLEIVKQVYPDKICIINS